MYAPLYPGEKNKGGGVNNCPVLSKMIQIRWYRSTLNNLISSMHSHHYEKDTHFEDNVLLALTPDEVYGWMANKFHGTPTLHLYIILEL